MLKATDGNDKAELSERDGIITVRVLTAQGSVLIFRFKGDDK